MSRVWQETAPEERLGEARPGALLTAAAAVPLGAAVLIAAGLLPWGARVALGLALAVLGLRVRALDGTTLGARIRPATARAIGAALLVGGTVVAVVAVGVALDGGHLESVVTFDEEAPQFGLSAAAGGPYGFFTVLNPTIDGWAGVGFGVLLAGAGPALARELLLPRVGVVLAGVGVAVALTALTGDGGLGLGPDARSAAAVVLALGGAVAVALRPGSTSARAAGVAAGLLLALLVGEGTGLLQLTFSGGIGPPFLSPTRDGAVAAVLAASAAISAGLLVVAVRQRDVALGVLPAGVLLLIHPLQGAVPEIGVLLVPALLVVVAGAAAAGLGAALRLVPRPAAPAAMAVAVVLLLVAVVGAFGPTSQFLDADRLRSGVQGGYLAVAIGCAAGVSLTAVVALRTDGPAGAVAAIATIVGLHLLHPLVLFRPAVPDSFVAHVPLAILLPLVELALGLVVARRHPTAPVLAAVGLLAVSALQSVAFGIATVDDGADGELVVALTLGPAVLAIAGGAAYALTGPARNVLRAQAFSAGATGGALLFAAFATSGFALVGETGEATLRGGRAVLALALVAVAAFGVALLAASTARRASAAVATAAIGTTATLAMVIAAVAAAVADRPADDVVRAIGTPAIQAALGFDDAGSVLGGAGAAWPVFLAGLGVVLLAAGAWLESQRPLPPDAPVG